LKERLETSVLNENRMNQVSQPFEMNQPSTILQRTRGATIALCFATIICALLLAVRKCFADDFGAGGLFWNLILAWIPYGLALGICSMLERGVRRRGLLVACIVLWVLFFPNAGYIVTDLTHWRNRPPVPKWFDYFFITAYAWTGLALGYMALSLIQRKVAAIRGPRIAWGFVIGMLGAGALGIYVGRFFRWNSWDVFTRPWVPLADLARFGQKETLIQVVGFCGTYFLLSLLVFVVFEAIARMRVD
jgi:uncharacterized membrane protein